MSTSSTTWTSPRARCGSCFPAAWKGRAESLHSRTKLAKVNGVALHYVVTGAGPVVLCMHGWPQQLQPLPQLEAEHVPPEAIDSSRSRTVMPVWAAVFNTAMAQLLSDKRASASTSRQRCSPHESRTGRLVVGLERLDALGQPIGQMRDEFADAARHTRGRGVQRMDVRTPCRNIP